jgi:ankyrin repeat protein
MSEGVGFLTTLIPNITRNDFIDLKAQLQGSVFSSRNVDFRKARYSVSVDWVESRFWNQNKPYKFVLPRENLTLLHICAIFDSLECFLLILHHMSGDDRLRVNSADSYTPLHYACLCGSLEIACFIIDQDPLQRRLNEKDLPFTRLALAAQAHSHYIIELIFDDFSLPFEGVDKAIEQALRHHDRLSLRILLKYPFPCQSRENPPLITAVLNHSCDAVDLLLEEGCDPHQPDKHGRMALEIACEKGGPPLNVIRSICQRMGSLEPQSTNPRTGPIHWLCKRRDLEIADLILSYKIMLDRIDNQGNQGPYYLIGGEDENIAVAILEKLLKAGYDVNTQDKRERTLLDVLTDRSCCWETKPKMV